MNFYGYSIRMTKDEDLAVAQAMLHPKLPELEKLFGKFDVPKMCEMCLYSVVAFSAENKMAAFAAFDDNPMATLPPGFPRDLSDKAGRWAVQSALDLGYRREMLLWTALLATFAAAGSEEEHTLHKAMLSAVLVLSHDTMVILETTAFEFGCLPRLLKPIAYYQKQDFKLSVCACRRSVLFPKLIMRRAREEDQDDLTPVIAHAQQRGLPLTQVPESACPSKPYAVARLIAAQTPNNNVFVAQVKNRIMGVIALTSDVHLPSLHKNYDLDCFEGLMAKTIVRKLTVVAEKEKDPFAFDPFAPAISEADAAATEAKQEEPAKPTSETFIQWPENAFRITMLCMDVEYESRAIDVIDFAFAKLNKEFCLVTLPYVSTYHPLLHFFYRVPARLNATNEDKELSADTRCLYLLHVDALSPGFAARHLKPDDKDSLAELLDNFVDQDKILDIAFNPPEERSNMVLVLSNHIVGFAILDKISPVAEIASHFDLQSLIHLEQHLFHNHATIVFYVLNPVYRYRSRLFLQEIMRQTGKSIIYCPVFPLMELPDILEDLILLPGRQHAHMAPPCYWTVPPPEDEEENASAERSSSKTTMAASTPRNKTEAQKRLVSIYNQKLLSAKVKKDAPQNVGEERSFSSEEQKTMENVSIPKADMKGVPEAGGEKLSASGGHKSAELHEKDLESQKTDIKQQGSSPESPPAEGAEIGEGNENSVAKSDPEKNGESDAQEKTHESIPADNLGRAGQGENAESNVSARGSPEKMEDSVKKRALEEAGSTKDIPKPEDREETAIKGGSSDPTGDNPESTEGDHLSNSMNSPIEEPEFPSPFPPIRRGYYHGFDCALYVLTHKNLYRYKTVINARVVVVGSSITTAGFLNKLLASHELQFTNLIMVSGAGFKRLSSTSLNSLVADLGPKYSFPKLGLDCQIKVIRANVKDINRKDRTVQLSNGRCLPYDWLVLSSGLQDQTKQSLQESMMCKLGGVVKVEELILNPSEIVKRAIESAGGGTDIIAPVVVYGTTLNAFGAIQALLQEGLEGKNMLLIHPETVNVETAATKYLGDTETSQMILATLIQAGLSIHSGMKLIHVEKDETTGWIKALEFQDLVPEDQLDGMSLVPTSLEKLAEKALQPLEALEELLERAKCPIHKVPMGDQKEALKSIHVVDKGERPERKVKVPCSMLVTGNKLQVDLPLFRAIHKEALIFDGRVVVDGHFQTNDPFIFAAGSLCKFSRRCGDDLPKCETFCPWEIGEALAPAVKAVIVTAIYGSRTRCASEEYVEILMPHRWPRPNLPSLRKPRCIGGLLPGEQWFFSTTAPKFCTPSASPPALTLFSRTADSYCRLDIMDNKEVGRLIYFGKVRLEEWKMVCFVGLPDTLLQDLVTRWQNDQVPDIVEYLLRPWATITFHDKFPTFFQNVSEEVRGVMRNSRTSMTVFLTELASGKLRSLEPRLTKQSGDIINKKLMGFLEQHRQDLPNYKIPQKVVG
ncbi:unnamed protein product [Calypogeia fissa]